MTLIWYSYLNVNALKPSPVCARSTVGKHFNHNVSFTTLPYGTSNIMQITLYRHGVLQSGSDGVRSSVILRVKACNTRPVNMIRGLKTDKDGKLLNTCWPPRVFSLVAGQESCVIHSSSSVTNSLRISCTHGLLVFQQDGGQYTWHRTAPCKLSRFRRTKPVAYEFAGSPRVGNNPGAVTSSVQNRINDRTSWISAGDLTVEDTNQPNNWRHALEIALQTSGKHWSLSRASC